MAFRGAVVLVGASEQTVDFRPLLRLSVYLDQVVEVLARNEDLLVSYQVMDVFHHLDHLRLEGRVGLEICQRSDQFFASFLVKLEFAAFCCQGLVDFFELLHHLLCAKDFQSNVVVFDFEI